ncbi:SAM-dependent methyltransferase [Micromonospora inyonensis]|uniref:SAM-dependent methyltransferase, MidA family n=1 Tax=Micromonospora inyonensis TaxID=47866 RepID=A0A1C6RC76_9ACTN|nr:SAM-dependent methyltransferase [Micromonospora inyonensis]SCL14763.1 SAM-dependent methyltransferase, MidA family [Micromonospora inyonensis]
MGTGWRAATTTALYGPTGFFVAGTGPAAHFRTSVHASPVFGGALLRLVERVDAALGHPGRLDVVDVGAGRGELLTTLAQLAGRAADRGGPARRAAAPRDLSTDDHSTGDGGRVPALVDRLRLTAVEVAPRPAGLSPTVDWRDRVPDGITGLLLATEWLDNVPLDVVVATDDGWRTVLVDPAGVESVGGPVDPADADWLATWWPASPGGRAEIGRTRDVAWAAAVRAVDRGLALAVDYGHLRSGRPFDGTLTGYRAGRQVPPVPDGSCDLTAHVAVDAVGVAGSAVAGTPYTLLRQREALRALGADGGRPPLALAATDPAGYVRALAAASAVTELTDPAGLGGHWWLLQPVGIPAPPLAPAVSAPSPAP